MKPGIVGTILIAVGFVHATGVCAQDAVLDQQQSVINTEAQQVLAIGTSAQQRLAQVVTAGRSGVLSEISLVVACAAEIPLTVQIQGVSLDKPNGTVLASYVFPGVLEYPTPPQFKRLLFLFPDSANPIHVVAGDRFAIVLSATPHPTLSCSTYPGPIGDPYPGGDAFVNSVTDPPGQWTRLTEGAPPVYGVDLPFQTWIALDFPTASSALTVPTLSHWGMIALLLLMTIAGLYCLKRRAPA